MNLNTTWSSRVSCSAISNAEWHSKGSAFPADIWNDQNSSEAIKVVAGKESAAEQRRKRTNLWSKWIRTGFTEAFIVILKVASNAQFTSCT